MVLVHACDLMLVFLMCGETIVEKMGIYANQCVVIDICALLENNQQEGTH